MSTKRRRDEPIRRLILSRKGFDSGSGGVASPILDGKRMLPLPIPSRGDSFRMRDLSVDLSELGQVLSQLSRYSLDSRVHLDPDLDRAAHLRRTGWRPTLGQIGAAQTHLSKHGVGSGDVFLFFGWFRAAEQDRGGRWHWSPAEDDLHVLFGWIEVDEVLLGRKGVEEGQTKHPWIRDHPHVQDARRRNSEGNAIYVARQHSRLVPGRPGGGMFRRFDPELQLTAPGRSRSVWSLPRWFAPGKGRSALSYHAAPERWSTKGDRCLLQSVARGQEFVLDLEGRPEATAWLKGLIRRFGGG